MTGDSDGDGASDSDGDDTGDGTDSFLVLFTQGPAGVDSEAWHFELDGDAHTQPQTMTHDGLRYELSLSRTTPDGEFIALAARTDAGRRMAVLDPDDFPASNPSSVDFPAAQDGWAQNLTEWDPTGRWMPVSTFLDGQRPGAYFVIDREGDPTQAIAVPSGFVVRDYFPNGSDGLLQTDGGDMQVIDYWSAPLDGSVVPTQLSDFGMEANRFYNGHSSDGRYLHSMIPPEGANAGTWTIIDTQVAPSTGTTVDLPQPPIDGDLRCNLAPVGTFIACATGAPRGGSEPRRLFFIPVIDGTLGTPEEIVVPGNDAAYLRRIRVRFTGQGDSIIFGGEPPSSADNVLVMARFEPGESAVSIMSSLESDDWIPGSPNPSLHDDWHFNRVESASAGNDNWNVYGISASRPGEAQPLFELEADEDVGEYIVLSADDAYVFTSVDGPEGPVIYRVALGEDGPGTAERVTTPNAEQALGLIYTPFDNGQQVLFQRMLPFNEGGDRQLWWGSKTSGRGTDQAIGDWQGHIGGAVVFPR